MINTPRDPAEKMTFEALYKKQFSTVCKYARNKLQMSENTVEDIANEAFLILLKNWDKVQPKTPSTLMSYLFKTATYLTYNHNRKAQKLPTVSFDDALAVPEEENMVEKFTFHEHLKHIKAELSEEEYLLFEQKVLNNYTNGEIAAFFGVSENTLKMRWQRLRKKIQKIY